MPSQKLTLLSVSVLIISLALTARPAAAGWLDTWSVRASGTASNINNAAYGRVAYFDTSLGSVTARDAYTAICTNGAILASGDAVTWDSVYAAPVQVTDIIFDGVKFDACAGSNFLTSGGTSWASTPLHGANPGILWEVVALSANDSGDMVAGGGGGMILCSSDSGTTWTKLYMGSILTYFTKFDFIPKNGHFVGLGAGGVIINIARNVNGTGQVYFTYSPVSSTKTLYLTSLTYIPALDRWFGVENVGQNYWIETTKDLNTWVNIDSGRGNITSLVYLDGMGFATGLRDSILTLTDSLTWTHRPLSAGVTLNDFASGSGYYVGVGEGGAVFTSPDGVNWTRAASGTTKNLFKVLYGGGRFAAFGANGTIITPGPGSAVQARPDGSGNFSLDGNSPNPFHPATAISFRVPSNAGSMTAVNLDVYDIRGQLVRRLVGGPVSPGLHAVAWDGRDGSGRPLAAGVYLCRLTAGKFLATRPLLMMQ